MQNIDDLRRTAVIFAGKCETFVTLLHNHNHGLVVYMWLFLSVRDFWPAKNIKEKRGSVKVA